MRVDAGYSSALGSGDDLPSEHGNFISQGNLMAAIVRLHQMLRPTMFYVSICTMKDCSKNWRQGLSPARHIVQLLHCSRFFLDDLLLPA